MTKPRGRGGVATVVDRLVRGLSPDGRVLMVGRRPSERLGVRALSRDTWRLSRRIRAGDVVHLHTSLRPRALLRDAALLAVARAHGCAVVLQVHGWDRAVARSGPRWARRILEEADAVLVVDPAAGHALRHWGVAAELIDNPFGLTPGPLRCPDPATAWFVGRIEVHKGVFDLLEAWATVLDTRPDARLVLAGDGDALPSVRQRIVAQGWSEQVSCVGWQHRAQLATALARATVLVLPSREEAAPLAVIEALAAGVQVVATRTGRVPELVGDAGELVEVGDPRALAGALLRSFSSPERGRLGPALVERCHPMVVARDLRGLYERLAA